MSIMFVLLKYLIKNVTTVDNRYSHSYIKFTNCNTKIPTKAISVLFATTILNTFGQSRAFGLISANYQGCAECQVKQF